MSSVGLDTEESPFHPNKTRYFPIPPIKGVLAQLVERLNGIEEVRGSNPLGSKLCPFIRDGSLNALNRSQPRKKLK